MWFSRTLPVTSARSSGPWSRAVRRSRLRATPSASGAQRSQRTTLQTSLWRERTRERTMVRARTFSVIKLKEINSFYCFWFLVDIMFHSCCLQNYIIFFCFELTTDGSFIQVLFWKFKIWCKAFWCSKTEWFLSSSGSPLHSRAWHWCT